MATSLVPLLNEGRVVSRPAVMLERAWQCGLEDLLKCLPHEKMLVCANKPRTYVAGLGWACY